MTFTSPLQDREPLKIAPEREALESWLDMFRAELLAKLEGLDDEQVARRTVGSRTTLHGLVRHMTKVEYVWFVLVILGSDETGPYGWPEVADGDFLLDGSEGIRADVQRYLDACQRSRDIFATVSLDDVRTHHRLGDVDVRWVMLHMLEEYAQHNGHADIVRELIDGTTQS
jgi:uncharacterized damage-inducible protein DinB